MVTKGIIEKILDNQQYRIRLPLYDSLATVSNATPTDNLGIGTVCTMPNSFIDYKIGDIVYVTFEDNDREHLVILGTISNETVKTVTEPSIQAQNLTLTNKATLPINTHIGNITPNEIACLATIRDNIQQQIDEIVVSSGGVISVNGKSGIVHLTASDVGALPDTAVIPTKTSDLTNDSGFITTSAIHDGVLTIKQNNETIGTFSANQTSSVTLELTDTTYENKAASSGVLDLSLLTTGEKYTWNNKSVVVANPTTTATATLTDIEIDGVTYVLSGGGGGGSVNSVNSVFPDANGNVLLTASDVGALPDSTVIPTVNNGELTIKLNGTTAGTFTANQSGKTTVELTDTTYAVVSKNGNGLCPQLPNETTTTKYLRQDGSWVVPPDTNTTYSFTGGTNKFTVTSGGTSTDITITPSITNNITGSGTSGYIAKFNGANTITNGPAFGSDTTKYLRNDGSWVVPPNDNTTYSAGQGLVLNSTTFKLGSGTVAHY